jgi:hypothetical protein
MLIAIPILHPLNIILMSIVIAILAGVFGFMFVRGLYNHIWYLYAWKKVCKGINANPNLTDEEKQEFLIFAREQVKEQHGIDLP